MDQAAWKDLKTQLGRLLNRDVRIFSDKKIEQFEGILGDPDSEVAANRLATELRNSPLEGDVLRELPVDIFEGLPPFQHAFVECVQKILHLV